MGERKGANRIMNIIETFYNEAKKIGVCVGNIHETERGIFVQFTPRINKKPGKYRTFKNLNDFIRYLNRKQANP